MIAIRLLTFLGLAAATLCTAAAPSPASALANAQMASAQVGPHADRIRSKLALIRVKEKAGSRTCTGVFLSARLVVTAGHCLINQEFVPVPASSITAARCLDKDSKACRWTEGKGFDIYPTFKRKAETTVYLQKNAAKSERFDIKRFHDWDYDLAVVLLAEDAASDVGHVPISDRPPIEGETHYYFGAGQTPKGEAGKMRVASFPVAWTINGRGPHTSQYQMLASATSGNCPGDSGGPIFVERDSTLLLAGIGVAARTAKKETRCADVAVIAIDLSRLKFWIDGASNQLQRQHAPPPPMLHPAVRSAIDRLGIGKRM